MTMMMMMMMINALQAGGVSVAYVERGKALQMTIRRLTPSNAGTYTCRSENNLGHDEESSTVVVQCTLSADSFFLSLSSFTPFSISFTLEIPGTFS